MGLECKHNQHAIGTLSDEMPKYRTYLAGHAKTPNEYKAIYEINIRGRRRSPWAQMTAEWDRPDHTNVQCSVQYVCSSSMFQQPVKQ